MTNNQRWLLPFISLCLFAWSAFAQADAAQGESSAPAVQSARQRSGLSPGAAEMARLLDLEQLLERYLALPESERFGRVKSLEALSLRQEMTEAVIAASLEVDGVVAEIDNELAQITAVRAQLEARRDRALAISNVAGIVTSGVGGIVGTALQFSEGTQELGNKFGVAGGAISTALSFFGLYVQRGGRQSLGVAPNLLAKLFDRQPEFHSDYPPEVWAYLNSIPPAEPGGATRRAQLIKQWTDAGRLEAKEGPRSQRRVEVLTTSFSGQKRQTIDLLTDRAAMLADVKARVSLMKRDLSKLMLALRGKS